VLSESPGWSRDSTRMVKILERLENQKSAMMDSSHQLLFPRPLHGSVEEEFDARSDWGDCSSTTTGRRPEVAQAVQPAGFYWSGFLCLALAVLQLTGEAQWSWWRVLLPLWAVSGHKTSCT
jgi:hypothetical protein